MDGQTNPTCECCKNLDPRETPWAGAWATGPVFEDVPTRIRGVNRLLVARRRGCPICTLLVDIVKAFVPSWLDHWELINVQLLAPHNRPLEVRIEDVPIQKGERPARPVEIVNVQVSRGNSTCIPEFPKLGRSLLLAQNPSHAKPMNFLKACLQQCIRQHSSHPALKTHLPLRVVNVGLDNENICIHESQWEKDYYVALSYCWGSAIDCSTLTTQTLNDYKQKIPWSRLPATIRHAIEIVRKIGIRYIWIDCLCIIQASRQDWQTESAKMAAYYRNALFTIAASSSSTVHGGIFNDRPNVSKPKEFTFHSKDGSNHSILAQTRPLRRWPSPVHFFGPLSERAWTLQEHALSTRIVHCVQSELIWECSQSMVSEDGHPINNNTFSLIGQLTDATFSADQAWRYLVRAYSARALTELGDKLPAIAGIASYIQSKTGYHYMDGLWKENLAVDLAWSRPLGWMQRSTHASPHLLRPPSWSWASIHGAIFFPMENQGASTNVTTHCTIDIENEPQDSNVFTMASNRILRIHAPFQKASIHSVGKSFYLTSALDLTRAMEEDSRFLSSSNLTDEQLVSANAMGQVLTFVPDTALTEAMDFTLPSPDWTVQRAPGRASQLHRGTVWCLWCFTTKPLDSRGLVHGRSMRTYGIVLGKKNWTKDHYFRVGSVCMPHSRIPDNMLMETVWIE